MVLNIHVALLEDNEEISFGAVTVYHASCSQSAMVKRRDVASDDYTLKCGCGLELVFPSGGSAKEEIIKVAIGGLPAKLEPSAFRSNRDVAYIAVSVA